MKHPWISGAVIFAVLIAYRWAIARRARRKTQEQRDRNEMIRELERMMQR